MFTQPIYTDLLHPLCKERSKYVTFYSVDIFAKFIRFREALIEAN